jgi:rRNA biogenesis protein RRP5
VDKEKKRVSLSLKASYFEDDDEEMPDGKDDESSNEAGDIIETDTEAPDDQMQIDSHVPTPVESQAEPLAVEAFNWTGETVLDTDGKMPAVSDSDSDVDADEAPKPRKHKRSEIKFDKTQALPLASSTDFERVLLSQPDSSQLWTQYMAHLLQLGQIDKARTIADRALKTINMREEGEKMNIWLALLNMENSFGTEDTLDAAFQRAYEYTDKKKMYTHMARILTTSGKDDKADETYQAMLKKFHQSCKMWVNYASFLIDHERQEEARELLQRSLRVLPKRKRNFHSLCGADFKMLKRCPSLRN